MQSAKISFVQREAQAPRFVALAQWFESQVVTGRAGNTTGRTAGTPGGTETRSLDEVVAATPDAYRAGVLAYLDQQIGRVDSMLRAAGKPGKAGDQELAGFFDDEADEMLDIIQMLLIENTEDVKPQTEDLLARLIHASRQGSNFIEKFSEPFLDLVFPEDTRVPLHEIKSGLEAERDRFAKALTVYYLDEESRPQLQSDLRQARERLVALREVFSGDASLGLTSGAARTREFGQLNGPVAAFLNFQTALLSAGGDGAGTDGGAGDMAFPARAGGGVPGALDLVTTDETSSGQGIAEPPGGSGSTLPPATGTGIGTSTPTGLPGGVGSPGSSGAAGSTGLMAMLTKFLNPNWFQKPIGLQDGGAVRTLTDAGAVRTLTDAGAPPYNCLGKGWKGRDLLNCQRYYAWASDPDDPGSAIYDTSRQTGLGLTSRGRRGNFSIVRRMAARWRAKQQGNKPACTAFATAQTIESQVDAEIDGDSIWNSQGRDMMLDSAISAAGRLYPQYRISSRGLSGVEEMIASIDQGVPVAISLPVGRDWFVNGGGQEFPLQGSGLGLVTAQGVPHRVICTSGGNRHVVSLQGYVEIDGALFFMVKNSWGSYWRDNGYAMLDWQTCANGLAQRARAVQAGR